MKRGFVRIIGGEWRGRRLKIASVPSLRPTPDRIRETLFNWLAPIIHQAHCLDVFSGTGVLGFEALSRGAASVVMIDQSPIVIDMLKEMQILLDATKAHIYRAKAPKQLRPPEHPFDIVFLDPPYDSTLLLPCCFYLEEQAWLAPSAYIYLEARRIIQDNELPRNWQIVKCQQAGQVVYHLARRVD